MSNPERLAELVKHIRELNDKYKSEELSFEYDTELVKTLTPVCSKCGILIESAGHIYRYGSDRICDRCYTRFSVRIKKGYK